MSSATPTGKEHAHEGLGHVVPLRVLFGTWGVLVLLTWVTVAAASLDLSNLNIVIALGIAAVKASYVVLYFMHLRYDKPFHAVVFIGAILGVMLFIGLALMDTKEYAATKIPGYAPEMEQAAGGTAAPAEPGAAADDAADQGAPPPGESHEETVPDAVDPGHS